MPTSSPQPAIRERRIAVMLREDPAFQAVTATAKAHPRMPLAWIAVITVVSALAVFLMLFHRDRALPHALIRPQAIAPTSPPESAPNNRVPRVQTKSFELRRARRSTELGSIRMRVLALNSRTKSCLLVLGRNRKTSRVRLHPGQVEPITSLGDPHLQIRVDSISRTSVTGIIEEP